MHSLRNSLCGAALALLLSSAASVADDAPALPNGATSLQETYDSWIVSCSAQSSGKTCVLSQQQVDKQTRQQVLAVQLQVDTGNKVSGTLVLPFGLMLSKGVRLQVDDAPQGAPLAFRTCLPVGCLVTLSFGPDSVVALRKGTLLKIAVTADGGKDTTLGVSLKGFPAALDRTAALSQ